MNSSLHVHGMLQAIMSLSIGGQSLAIHENTCIACEICNTVRNVILYCKLQYSIIVQYYNTVLQYTVQSFTLPVCNL